MNNIIGAKVFGNKMPMERRPEQADAMQRCLGFLSLGRRVRVGEDARIIQSVTVDSAQAWTTASRTRTPSRRSASSSARRPCATSCARAATARRRGRTPRRPTFQTRTLYNGGRRSAWSPRSPFLRRSRLGICNAAAPPLPPRQRKSVYTFVGFTSLGVVGAVPRVSAHGASVAREHTRGRGSHRASGL